MENTEIILEDEKVEAYSAWNGAESPFQTSYGKLMMWYFLLSDAFTFAGFLIAYGALRFSSATWPVPDFVFSTAPFGIHGMPLIFVTFMSFLLIISSVTMVRGVQEGHRENKRGVVFWMLLTIVGGAGFLGCQAWEWNNLINTESMTVLRNPFGTHTVDGTYLQPDGSVSEGETFQSGESYLIHAVGADHGGDEAAAEHDAEEHPGEAPHYTYEEELGDYPGYTIAENSGKKFILRKYRSTGEEGVGAIQTQEFGPQAFGALFFGITGFHGFHVFSGVIFLTIIMINAGGGVYAGRKNGYEMVEKIGLYWHFVDLVWVFVFLVFYLL